GLFRLEQLRLGEIAAAIFGPGRFVVPEAARLLLAEAHRLDLLLARTQQHQQSGHRFGASLAERQVVLRGAALVGVADDDEPGRRIRAQPAGVALYQRAVLRFHVV